MLIQLPTGEWVKPSEVTRVSSSTSIHGGIPKHSVIVYSRDGCGRSHYVDSESEAVQLRDKIAALVNAGVSEPVKPQNRDWSQPIVVDADAQSIWQALFDIYRECGGELDDIGDMLIDYDTIREARLHAGKFAWGFLTGSSRTELRLAPADDVLKAMESRNDNLFLIEVGVRKATITCLR